jgi:hypothetical protein
MARHVWVWFLAGLVAGAAGCADSSPAGDSGVIPCLDDRDCPRPLTCQDGVCALPWEEPADGGDGEADAGLDGDAPDGDAPDGDVGGEEETGPEVTVEPEALDFGDGRIGQPVDQLLRVRSRGTLDLTVFSVGLEAGTSPEFHASPLGTLNEVLPPGSELLVLVRYTPADGVADQGALLIATNDPRQALTRVPLSSSYKGASEIEVVGDPASSDEVEVLDLGPVLLGGSSSARLVVKNAGSGNAVLRIEQVRTEPLASANFQLEVAPAPPVWLSPYDALCVQAEECGDGHACVDPQGAPCAGAGCYCVDGAGQPLEALSIRVTFAPQAVGPVEEQLVIVNDEADGDERPRIVTLRGEGLQALLRIAPNPVQFAALFVGEQDQVEVTLSNAGNQVVSVSAVALLGGGGPFSLQVVGLPWALSPGGSRSFIARYAPLAPGNHQDLLRVTSDDPHGPIQAELRGSASLRPPEVCNGLDDDFDGLTDADDPDLVLAPCSLQDGVCAGSRHTRELCQDGGWQACPPSLYGPGYGQEVCDGLDNDCNGLADSSDPALRLDLCENQQGVCQGARHRPSQCTATGWEPCQPSDYLAHAPAYGPEQCGNQLDEDCSGALDDRDLDGDGHRALGCAGGDDCDDGHPGIHPGVAEVWDTLDNDCDGLIDEGVIPVGTVIVTEVMLNPSQPPGDTLGEWFEVTNTGAQAVNLHGWRVRDDGSNTFIINRPQGLRIEPGQSGVLCRRGNPAENGGVSCDYEYGEAMQLANDEDEIELVLDGLVLDRVAYGSGFPLAEGRSSSLDLAAYSHTANDQAANWCSTPALAAYLLPSGDHGSPGRLNPSCSGALVLASVEPTSGLEQGGETLRLHGSGFTGLDSVRLCGSACTDLVEVSDSQLTCRTPAHAPGDCDVVVSKGANQATLPAGYRYTGVATSPGIGWCALQWPRTVSVAAGVDSELVFGRVYKAGVTEPAGAPAGISGQLGYGPLGTDPRSTPGWRWLQAAWNPSCEGCGNNDEFMRQFNLAAPGAFSYVYRFSEDGGFRFVFCDFDPGTGDGFSVSDLGTLTVSP